MMVSKVESLGTRLSEMLMAEAFSKARRGQLSHDHGCAVVCAPH